MSWQVLFETKMCSCPYMEKECWKMLRMTAMQYVLPHFEFSSKDQKPTIRRLMVLGKKTVCQKDESWLQESTTSLLIQEISPPITIIHTRSCAVKIKRVPLLAYWCRLRTSQRLLARLNFYSLSPQWRKMIFSVFIDGVECPCDFGPASVITVTAGDIVQEISIVF